MNLKILLYSFLTLIGIFLALFWWSSYRYYEMVHADDPIDPLLVVTNGTSKIVRADYTYVLSETESYELETNDIIETWLESRATITWPDKSVTRLWPKTRIVIEKMYASNNYDSIEIAYSMESGKVWNTLIRSLVWDSYFEVHLPRESIVAGVRGTIFEINLDNKYIRAVDHSTKLTQRNESLEIFPGDMVDSENIFIKKGREWLDAQWNEWNKSSDILYESLRTLEIEKRINMLTEDIGKINISNSARKMLLYIPGFEDINISELLKENRLEELKNISSESLLSYYQKLGNFGNENIKEPLRNSLLSLDNQFITNIRDSLEMHALWETLDTGKLTETTKQFLESKWVNVDGFKTKFLEGAKNDLNTFRETLSGWLNSIIGY